MRNILFASFIALLVAGCEKQDRQETREEIGRTETGEGLFGMKDGNASVETAQVVEETKFPLGESETEIENEEGSIAKEADRLLNEAADLCDQGKYAEAKAGMIRARSVLEQLEDKDHPKIIQCLKALVDVSLKMQENDEVIEYAGEVANLALADEDKGLAYNRIGLAYFNKGEYDKAIEYDEKSLALYLGAGGPDDPNVALNYNNIGLAYTQKGEYDKAIGYFEKTLALYFKILGPEHPEVATTYNQLGLAYFKTGEYDRAVECNEKALAIRLKAFDPEHPYVGMSYGNLGSLYAKKGMTAKAMDYLLKAKEIHLKKHGPQHPETKNIQKWIDSLK